MSTTIVCPFVIAVENREQLPYGFEGMPLPSRYSRNGRKLVVPLCTKYLKSGDYSIVGMEDQIAVERKSIVDCYMTLGQNRDRFEAEVQRLNEFQFSAIVIEAGIPELWRPADYHPGWRSRLHPRSVEGTIVHWSLRYPRVHWWPMGSRRAAEIRVFEVLHAYWQSKQ